MYNKLGERKDAKMTLGNIIREYRESHGMSLEAFGKLSGMSKSYVDQLEKNKHPRTGNPISPTIETIKQVADAINVPLDEVFKLLDGEVTINEFASIPAKAQRIPILGKVAAGKSTEMIEDVLGDVVIENNKGSEYFALEIKGDSMLPRIEDGDIVIVRKQDDIESGDLAIVSINGDDATCKRLKKYRDGIELIALNPSYGTRFFTNEEIESEPVTIIGKVVELRAKF